MKQISLIIDINEREKYNSVVLLDMGQELQVPSASLHQDDETTVLEILSIVAGNPASGSLVKGVRVGNLESRLDFVRNYYDPDATVYAVEFFNPDMGVFGQLPVVDERDLRQADLIQRHQIYLIDYFNGYKRFKNPTPTVDILVEYNGCLVFVQRPKGWALPGGHCEYQMTYEDTVIKEAEEELGLMVRIVEVLGTYSDPHRNPDRMIANTATTAYIVEATGGLLGSEKAEDAVLNLGVFPLAELESYLKGNKDEVIGDLYSGKGICNVGKAKISHALRQDILFDHPQIARDYFSWRLK